jgi:hypothetical protein
VLTTAELGFRVLGRAPRRSTPGDAADALGRFLERKRPGLAQMLRVEPAAEGVRVAVRGERPDEALRELNELLRAPDPGNPAGALTVDPEEFHVEITTRQPRADERVILRSRVRSFPYPVCQWFDISTGLLTLTDARLVYEPEDLIMDERGLAGGHVRVVELAEIRRAYRGTWWDVPCLMLDTQSRTLRYGWPARRDEPELEFRVGEWVDALRTALSTTDTEEPHK